MDWFRFQGKPIAWIESGCLMSAGWPAWRDSGHRSTCPAPAMAGFPGDLIPAARAANQNQNLCSELDRPQWPAGVQIQPREPEPPSPRAGPAGLTGFQATEPIGCVNDVAFAQGRRRRRAQKPWLLLDTPLDSGRCRLHPLSSVPDQSDGLASSARCSQVRHAA